jgi:beta-glucosidase
MNTLVATDRVEALLAEMTLAEKIGQMTQVEKNSLTAEDVSRYALGSVLSGGGGNPDPNTPENWAAMTRVFAEAALQSRLKIPLIYGADCVHGHNNCKGAVIFPHNIALGATRDADLVERIGAATAREILATHVHWNFAPCLAVPQDLRWGRTFEGYGQDVALVTELGAAYVRGLQREGAAACIKHFVGDGGAEWDTHQPAEWALFWEMNGGLWKIDQGDVRLAESAFRALHLAPYLAGIAEGALTVMASFSSWNGQKMHQHHYLLTEVLKGELGFQGFVVSDWMGINQLSPDYATCVIQGINAGLDMIMVPYDFKGFIATLTQAVEAGQVPLSRIDDAVRRILWVKHTLGLFETPIRSESTVEIIGSADHRALAREAVRKSLVLLKNEQNTLPLPRSVAELAIAGVAANDLGFQSGGWTVEWQGKIGSIIPGTTLVQGVRQALPEVDVAYSPTGDFAAGARAEVGIVVVAELPYAEGCGDVDDLNLSAEDVALIQRVRAHCERLVLLVYSGRPLILSAVEPLCDAIVMAWQPGSEGAGVVDVLCGDYPFSGTLPVEWIASMDQLPLSHRRESGAAPLYPYGYGLTT